MDVCHAADVEDGVSPRFTRCTAATLLAHIATSFFESNKNSLPSSVSASLLLERSSSLTPISSSRLRTCRVSDGWASRSHFRRLAEAQRLGDCDEIAQVAKLHLPEHRVSYSKKLSLILRKKVCFLQCQWDEGVFDIAFGYGSGIEEVLAEFE